MTKKLLTQIKNEWLSNLWLVLELLVVSVVMWYVCLLYTSVFDSWPNMVPEGVEVRVSGEMLFAPLVFLAALALCVVLNLLSACLLYTSFSPRPPASCG